MDSSCMEFDMVGVDAAIANTFRRILIAEVRFIRAFSSIHLSQPSLSHCTSFSRLLLVVLPVRVIRVLLRGRYAPILDFLGPS